MKMKEKLVKNHYKGFDKKARIFLLASIGLLIVSVCVFLPLTAIMENRVETLKVENNIKTNQKETSNLSSPEERIIITYVDEK